MEFKFDLQQYLERMNADAQSRHADLDGKVDSVLAAVSKHDARISSLETSRKHVVWFFSVIVVGGISAAWDYVFNHLGKH